MVKANKILKLLFICLSFILLMVLVISPKTDCQACALRDGNKLYDGYQAFEIFEDACISYAKPWSAQAIPNITDSDLFIYNEVEGISYNPDVEQ